MRIKLPDDTWLEGTEEEITTALASVQPKAREELWLSSNQAWVLNALRRRPSATLKQLAEEMRRDKASVQDALDDLIDLAYVTEDNDGYYSTDISPFVWVRSIRAVAERDRISNVAADLTEMFSDATLNAMPPVELKKFERAIEALRRLSRTNS